MTGAALRPATEADVRRLTELVEAAYGHYVERLGGPPRPMTDDYADVVRSHRVTVAEHAGEIAGLIVLRVDAEGFLVDNVAVDPSHQGTGVGRRLLEHAETVARRDGFDSIYLYTHERMTENLALYSRLGYVEYDRRLHGEDRLVYLRKTLGLVSQEIELPSGGLRVLQPAYAAELPDTGAVEWAPIAPYWSVLWRSGVALARELDRVELRGLRVVELGCGLAVPSIAAARAGATVLATDTSAEALALAARNAHANGVRFETATVDWAEPDELAGRGPFDLVLAADLLYERASVAPLLSLLPRLAPVAWLADPGRPAAGAFLEEASRRWRVETRVRDVVRIHRLQLGGRLQSAHEH